MVQPAATYGVANYVWLAAALGCHNHAFGGHADWRAGIRIG